MFSKKKLFVMMLTLLLSGCNKNQEPDLSGVDTLRPASLIMPKSEEDPFILSNLQNNLMSVDHGLKNQTLIVQTGSGYLEALFDQNGLLKEVFNPLTGYYIQPKWMFNRLYVMMYDQQKKIKYGIVVFEARNSIWIGEAAMLPVFFVKHDSHNRLDSIQKINMGLNNIRKIDQKNIFFYNRLDPSAQIKHINMHNQLINNIHYNRYIMIGTIEAGLRPVVDHKNSLEISNMFAGTALIAMGQMSISDSTKRKNIIRCLKSLEECKQSNQDHLVSMSMSLFSGLLAENTNQNLLKNILGSSKLNWDKLEEVSYRFFDPTKDPTPPSFKRTVN